MKDIGADKEACAYMKQPQKILSGIEPKLLPDEGQTEMPLSDYSVLLPSPSFLLQGQYEQVGFDLVVTNPSGQAFVVEDYFSFSIPPNLMVSGGAGYTPEVVLAKMHLSRNTQFAGPGDGIGIGEQIGEVSLVVGKVIAKRAGEDGVIEEVQLSRGDKVFQGDEIVTGPNGFIKLKLLDGTRFNLGQDANAILTDFSFDEVAQTGNFGAFVNQGGFKYKSGKIGEFGGLDRNPLRNSRRSFKP